MSDVVGWMSWDGCVDCEYGREMNQDGTCTEDGPDLDVDLTHNSDNVICQSWTRRVTSSDIKAQP